MRRGCILIAAVAVAVVFAQAATVRADDWPQWRGPTRDGVWHEKGIVEKFAEPQLPLLWRAPLGSGYTGPTVANGKVYATDRVIAPKQIERVHCFDAATGKTVWMHEYDCAYRDVGYDAGPRASVLIDDGKAYSLGTMGNFICFDAATGEILWQKDLNAEYKIRMPVWGIAASPIIEGDLIIVMIGGENGACLVAFDRKTGKEVWKALDDNASYSAPVVIEQAGKRVLVCWTGERVVGLDPATGKAYWAEDFVQRRMIINIADPVKSGDYLFMSSFFDGSQLLKLDHDKLGVSEVWRRMGEDEQHTETLHTIIATPFIQGDYVYGVDSYGELRCLNLLTGDRVWEDLTAVPKARWATIHFVKHDDDVWMFNERGELIISKVSPEGFHEISRAKLLEPTMGQLPRRGGVCWSHPAFANGCVFARNDNEIVCADLKKR
ncbi:MAG: PQQ-like beta-propeller repeat protein [Phycisphaerales bacterium]|nr:PQQ-like beta-propeller repeat protein [Phycisphaerales bacterium]